MLIIIPNNEPSFSIIANSTSVLYRSSKKVSYYEYPSSIASNTKLRNFPFPQKYSPTLSKITVRTNNPSTSIKMYIHLNLVQHTIVLDLDETLIHCNQSIKVPYDVKLAIKFPGGQKIQAGINIRPFAKVLLKELAQICEVIIFTASHECYANVVLDYLDPEKRLISHRLFR